MFKWRWRLDSPVVESTGKWGIIRSRMEDQELRADTEDGPAVEIRGKTKGRSARFAKVSHATKIFKY